MTSFRWKLSTTMPVLWQNSLVPFGKNKTFSFNKTKLSIKKTTVFILIKTEKRKKCKKYDFIKCMVFHFNQKLSSVRAVKLRTIGLNLSRIKVENWLNHFFHIKIMLTVFSRFFFKFARSAVLCFNSEIRFYVDNINAEYQKQGQRKPSDINFSLNTLHCWLTPLKLWFLY